MSSQVPSVDPAPFFKAVCDGDSDRVREMLAISPDMAGLRDDGATPLHLAAIHNHKDVVDLLIEAGADLNARDDEYGSAPIGWANEKGHTEMTTYLFEKGSDVDLHRAAAFGFIERVKQLLSEDASLINETSGFGTPLHEASVWGHPEIVSLLLANGADPTLLNTEGETAFTIASNQVERNCSGTPIVIDSRRAEIKEGCRRVVEILSENTGSCE